jgi:hypothetical protein
MRRLCTAGLLALFGLALGAPPGRAQLPTLPPPPPVVPALPVVPGRVPTVAEFAATFQPVAGNYEITLQHPFTGYPVKVCLTLPPGCAKARVHHRRRLEFDYGKRGVNVVFDRRGGVQVKYG